MSTNRKTRTRDRTFAVQTRTGCAICGATALTEVVCLPQLPLTGIYVRDHENDSMYPKVDQALDLCQVCRHGQLRYLLDETYLYEDTYTHRGSESTLAVGVNEFFAAWLEELTRGHTFARVLDVGCGDLYLLRRLAAKGKRLLGVDPIWRGQDHQADPTIAVRGGFINEVDVVDGLGGAPDLIVSNHTFEHIADVGSQLRHLLDIAADGALIAVEVPSFDSLLAGRRFDQVFHQHVNYFSLASFLELIRRSGGNYVGHTHNFSFWGGSLLIAFRKQAGDAQLPAVNPPTADAAIDSWQQFRRQLSVLAEVIERVNEPLSGYGAAQILPMLAYHLQTDLSFLRAIYDDNPRRRGLSYPHLVPTIEQTGAETTFAELAILVTALDSVRPIVRRAAELNARRIIVPLNQF